MVPSFEQLVFWELPAISWIPWITDKILEAVFQKAAPRLAKDSKEWRRLCSVVRVKTKGDRERYMYQHVIAARLRRA